MPDLVFCRGAEPPVKMVCVYCGKPATHADERRVRNPRLDPPVHDRGGDSFGAPAGDDPISGCIALALLPFVLIGLFKRLRADWRHRVALRGAPALDPPYTLVTITTCARHRNYWRRFVWGAVLGLAVFTVAWAAVVLLRHEPRGAPLWLVVGALVGTIAFPMIFLMLYASDGPVRASGVTRDAVTVSNVRQAYFDAAG